MVSVLQAATVTINMIGSLLKQGCQVSMEAFFVKQKVVGETLWHYVEIHNAGVSCTLQYQCRQLQ